MAILISSSPFKCPAAPYEAAFLVKDLLDRRGRMSDVDVYTPEPFPMPTAGPDVGAAMRGMLESRGIGFHVHKVSRIDAEARALHFENGKTAAFDLLLGVPPPQALPSSQCRRKAGA